MADIQMGAVKINFANSIKATSTLGGIGPGLNSPTNYRSISGLRGRLAAANPSYYTEKKMDEMTVNDMVFALRNIDDPTTIADYMTNSAA